MKASAGILLAFVAMLVCFSPSLSAQTWKELANRSDSLWKAKNPDSAIVTCKALLELTRKEFGGDDTITARVLHRLGTYYLNTSSYAEADTLLRQALGLKIKLFGPNNLEVALSAVNVARLDCDLARFAEAEELLQKAIAIREQLNGREHPGVAECLTILGNIYAQQARYRDAIQCHERALAIREKALGSEHLDVSISLNNLAMDYWVQGRDAEAEPLLRRVLAIREKVLGPDDPQLATVLSNLGNIYYDLSRVAEAEQYWKRALSIREKSRGPDHPEVAASLSNLGALNNDQGKYAVAESLYIRALMIREKAFGQDHPDVGMSMTALANAYLGQERYSEAESLLSRSLGIRERALGPSHPDVALTLGAIADLYYFESRFADAEVLYKKMLSLLEKAIDPGCPYVANYRESLSRAYRANGQFALGIMEESAAFDIRIKLFHDNACMLSEKDALAYSRSIKSAGSNYLSCLIDFGAIDRDSILEGGTVMLESKGIVSEAIMERQRQLTTEKDSTTLNLAESVRGARMRISRLYSAGPGNDTTGAYKRELDSLVAAADDLEAELSRHSASFQRLRALNNISVERISSALPLGTTLVEYLKWDYHQLKPDSLIPRYAALIIGKNEKPEIVNLGSALEIEPLVERLLKHMQQLASSGRMPNAADMAEYEPISRAIYEKIWRPLEKHFKKNQTIFVGLDGSLNLVSLAGLIDEEGKYLTEKYVLHHLSSGRDLIRLKDKPESGRGLFALGDPDFDATISARTQQPGEVQFASTATGEREYRTRDVRSGCGSLSDLKVGSLPFTRAEIEMIAKLWPGRGEDSAQVYVGPKASEDQFKAAAPGKRVLHLATHGYYLTGQCAPQFVAKHNVGPDESFVGENPLLQSGLLLAGANLHGAGCDSAHVDDGILSASEVSGMNLMGTDLVVLSACETGLGEVKSGEGVYGLRRAFQMAGARTVISSLWPVPDEATAAVMSQLYSQSKKPIPERLRDLQLAEIRKLRAARLPDHPYTWGAFISLGDWR